jgi:hypothetical protein
MTATVRRVARVRKRNFTAIPLLSNSPATDIKNRLRTGWQFEPSESFKQAPGPAGEEFKPFAPERDLI